MTSRDETLEFYRNRIEAMKTRIEELEAHSEVARTLITELKQR